MNDENISDGEFIEVQQPSTPSKTAGDAEIAGVGFLNSEPRFKCEGYNKTLGLCPHEATKDGRYGGFVHKLCELCHKEYRAERDQWKRDQEESE